MAFTIINPLDIFAQTGRMWNHFNDCKSIPHFNVQVVTATGEPLKCLSGVRIMADGSIDDVKQTDLIVISSVADINRTMSNPDEVKVIDWLRERYQQGTHIATICSGAFVLAETGLLDRKSATTHWGFAEQFRKRYPQIKLKIERIITDEGDLFCSGGGNAATDLSLYLVEKYCGREVALQTSKAMVTDIGRNSQTPYSVFQSRKDHSDERILAIQGWIEDNFNKDLSYNELAMENGMSRRTLERRFKAATGETPLTYQKAIRIEAAKRYLENGLHSFDEITNKVGYKDSSTFRKIFREHTGLVPTEYRKRFRLPHCNYSA